MRKIVYFKEDTQELKFLPIVEDNCFYLGNLTAKQIQAIESLLSITTTSFRQLAEMLQKAKENIW